MPGANVKVAEQNTEDLLNLFRHLKHVGELEQFTPIFDDFVEQVAARKKISINLKGERLRDLLKTPTATYQNMHDAFSDPYAKNILPPDKRYWYERRMEIEKRLGFIPDDKQIYYGALNSGNAGIQQYGPYCLILNTNGCSRHP